MLFRSRPLLSPTPPHLLLISTPLCWSSCTAKPSVRYADRITMSPDPSGDEVQRSPSQRTDNDFDDDGGYHSPTHTAPPSPFVDPPIYPPRYPPRYRRRTGAQSGRRRTTFGSRSEAEPRPVTATSEQGTPSITMIQRMKTNISTLLVPGHKVGDPPGFVRELKTILFGSCASYWLISERVWFSDPVYQILTFFC